MQDNSDLFAKIAIRQKAIRIYSRPLSRVADCYAGEGVITQMLWSGIAKAVLCIDKDSAKISKITANNVIKKIGDNVQFLTDISECDIIDCDAYGLVMPFINQLAPLCAGKIVVFTDGTPEKGRKVYSAFKAFNADCKRLFAEYSVELSNGGNAYYGYGILK
jgi:tRNA G26 N,N-dimethylase Trm1